MLGCLSIIAWLAISNVSYGHGGNSLEDMSEGNVSQVSGVIPGISRNVIPTQKIEVARAFRRDPNRLYGRGAYGGRGVVKGQKVGVWTVGETCGVGREPADIKALIAAADKPKPAVAASKPLPKIDFSNPATGLGKASGKDGDGVVVFRGADGSGGGGTFGGINFNPSAGGGMKIEIGSFKTNINQVPRDSKGNLMFGGSNGDGKQYAPMFKKVGNDTMVGYNPFDLGTQKSLRGAATTLQTASKELEGRLKTLETNNKGGQATIDAIAAVRAQLKTINDAADRANNAANGINVTEAQAAATDLKKAEATAAAAKTATKTAEEGNKKEDTSTS